MFTKALEFFRGSDAQLFELGNLLPEPVEPMVRAPEVFFQALCHSIISQQLSTRVADVIQARFDALFPDGLTPEHLLKVEDDVLRGLGFSAAKVKYAKDLASKVASGEVEIARLAELSDEEVIEALVKVKGIGQWTAEMFLIFTLGRKDIFSAGDLALRQSVAKWYGEEVTLKPEILREFAQKWSPYRSYASLILWKTRDLK